MLIILFKDRYKQNIQVFEVLQDKLWCENLNRLRIGITICREIEKAGSAHKMLLYTTIQLWLCKLVLFMLIDRVHQYSNLSPEI